MAGHSQFKNIMHRKGRQDAAKAKLFSKLAREITVSAKHGTPDPEMNPRLRLAIQAARAENMPKDNIERAIKKALGRRRRDLRGDPLRGLRPGRRRHHRRGADRQPQPHGRRRARRVHQVRRQPRRHGLGRAHVRARRRDRLSGERRLGRRDAGGGDRGRRGRRDLGCRRPRRHLRVREPRRGRRRAGGEARRAGSGQGAVEAEPDDAVDEEKAAVDPEDDRRASRTTTTCRTSSPTSRCPTKS